MVNERDNGIDISVGRRESAADVNWSEKEPNRLADNRGEDE